MKDVLDEVEFAELLECEPTTVQEQARRGELPGVKIGRGWIFPRTAILEALHQKAMDNMRKPATAAPRAIKKPQPLRRVPPVLPI